MAITCLGIVTCNISSGNLEYPSKTF